MSGSSDTACYEVLALLSPFAWSSLAVVLLAVAACGDSATGAPGAASGGENDPSAFGSVDGTDPTTCSAESLPDGDSDGWSDAVEEVLGTSASDPADNPTARHMNVILSPYEKDPSGTAEIVGTTALARADVAILLDTTGSMEGTTARMDIQIPLLFDKIAGLVDDVALGLAGYGDFPLDDGSNSDTDVPFYLVHRMMTVRTKAGMDSLLAASHRRNVRVDGIGPWFATMRGGDEPEQGWEALRQAVTGIGISYPGARGGTFSVPAFSTKTAWPKAIPSGEEAGTIGGMGFRADATPVIIMVTDTNNHDTSFPGTSPAAATRSVALAAVKAAHARVVGLMAWGIAGHDDLAWIASSTGATVAPDAWGDASTRPQNCPVGRCCLAADDSEFYPPPPATQPLPVNGQCTLVFQSDKYSQYLSAMIAQAVAAIAHGAPTDVGARLDTKGDQDVDVAKELTLRVEARTSKESACAGATATDTNGDGQPDTFEKLIPGASACFDVVPKRNTTIAPKAKAQRFDARLQLTADGVASLRSEDVVFVVPPAGECAPAVSGHGPAPK